MRIAYLDAATGISGDMTLAALIDAGVDAPHPLGHRFAGPAGVELRRRAVVKGRFRAHHVRSASRAARPPQLRRHQTADRRTRPAILAPSQKDLALRIFERSPKPRRTSTARPSTQVHFHEVGAIDSIVDIVGVAVGFDLLAADQIVCSPHSEVGPRLDRIAHGICPVPAPGTAELLRGIPLVDVPIEAN